MLLFMSTYATYAVLALMPHLPSAVNAVVSISDPPLRVASWNIQVFGQSKIKKEEAVAVILKVMRRYDLICIQEIRDSKETALGELVNQLNEFVGAEDENRYIFNVSERLGNSTSKEQYAFVYRKNMMEIVDVYQYPVRYQKFERPPFAAHFTSKTEISEFAIMNIHTSPSKAVEEIDYLKRVYELLENKWPNVPLMIAGDFNADCTYVKSGKDLALRQDTSFVWLIGDSVDTTVKSTDCSYDRFVTRSQDLVSAMVPKSIGVFYYDKTYGLSEELAEDVSDHYPIEFTLKGKINKPIQAKVQSKMSFTVYDSDVKTKSKVRYLYRDAAEIGFRTSAFKVNTKNHHVTATKENTQSVVADLEALRSRMPGLINDVTVAVVKAWLESESFNAKPYVVGLREAAYEYGNMYDFVVYCTLQDPVICQVTVSANVN